MSEKSAVRSTVVIIPTYNRPELLRTCLTRLADQSRAPDEIVVVDASTDSRTFDLVAEFPGVRYLRNPFGAGTLATSRLIGVKATDSDVVAFVDDDAFPRRDWLTKIVEPYDDPIVGGVGGRISNGFPGEELPTDEPVGALLANGQLTGNFAVDTKQIIDVDHFIGANMSYRRTALNAVGGIHDLYPGTCLREDSDTALRIGRAGWSMKFQPQALVDHVSGEYAKGKRFDVRYSFYAQRNHLVMLGSVLGVRTPQFRRSLRIGLVQALSHLKRIRHAGPTLSPDERIGFFRRAAGAIAHTTASIAGLLFGLLVAISSGRAG